MQAKMFKAVDSRLFFRARCSSSSLCVEVQTMYKSKSVPIKNIKQPNNNISAVIGEAMKATALSKNCSCFQNTILLRLDIFGNDCRNEEEDESSLFWHFIYFHTWQRDLIHMQQWFSPSKISSLGFRNQNPMSNKGPIHPKCIYCHLTAEEKQSSQPAYHVYSTFRLSCHLIQCRDRK